MSIGDNIKRIRKEKKITQRELAKKTGLSAGAIQQYEYNQYTPKLNNLINIAKALDVDLSDLTNDPSEKELIKVLTGTMIDIASIDNINDKELVALRHFRPLNDKNKDKAIDYMDLLKLQQDQLPDPADQAPVLYAAHERTDIKVTDEMRKHDDNIMDDDDF